MARFLHYLAELSGQGHIAFAADQRGFDLQNVAADLGPRQAVHQADLALAGDVLFAVTNGAEQFLNLFSVDDDLKIVLVIGRDILAGDLSKARADLAFEIANARLACVMADRFENAVVSKDNLFARNAAAFALFRYQVAFGDLGFLAFRVTGKMQYSSLSCNAGGIVCSTFAVAIKKTCDRS